jgi:hypothetical protein
VLNQRNRTWWLICPAFHISHISMTIFSNLVSVNFVSKTVVSSRGDRERFWSMCVVPQVVDDCASAMICLNFAWKQQRNISIQIKKNRKFSDAERPNKCVPWQSQNFLLYYQTSSCIPCQLHLLVADSSGFGSEKRIKILHMLEQIKHQKHRRCITCVLAIASVYVLTYWVENAMLIQNLHGYAHQAI